MELKTPQTSAVKKSISVSFQRKDTKQYSQHKFVAWDRALKFARWVADSPELELLTLNLDS